MSQMPGALSLDGMAIPSGHIIQENLQTVEHDNVLFSDDDEDMVSQLCEPNVAGQHDVPMTQVLDQHIHSPELDHVMATPTERGTAEWESELDSEGETVQPSPKKRSKIGASSTLSQEAHTTAKCRTREVDFSLALREKLYSKEASAGRLKAKMRDQIYEKKKQMSRRYEKLLQTTLHDFQAHSNTLTSLQTVIGQKESELVSLQNELQAQGLQNAQMREHLETEQQKMSERHTYDMDNFREHMMVEVRARIEKIEASKAADIEAQVKAHMTRLQEAMLVEKERELASLEQRYSRNSTVPRPEGEQCMEDDSRPSGEKPEDMTRPSNEKQPERPWSKPKPSLRCPKLIHHPITPSLDAIKQIRKRRHASARTRLISIDEDEPMEYPTSEESGPDSGDGRHEVHNPKVPSDIASVIEAVSKSVDALHRILANGCHPTLPKRSPRRRRKENTEVELQKKEELREDRIFVLGQVRRLLKDRLGITQDIEIITHKLPAVEDVHEYEYQDGPEPELSHPAFDLTCTYSSPWNAFVLNSLLCELQERCVKENWAVKRSDNYIQDILKDRYKRLRTIWIKARPKLTSRGVLETPEETEARLVKERIRVTKECRQATRRRNKYQRRMAVLQRLIALKSEGQELPEEDNIDISGWKWLNDLFETLGEHGMSSEESAVENGVENILRVKQMEWRRNIDRELEIVDRERVLDSDIFSPQGSKPLPRKRAFDNPESSRIPVARLPLALYDKAWFLQLTERQKAALQPSEKHFKWKKIVVA